MLEYVGERKIAKRMEHVIFDVLEEGKYKTGDLGGRSNTKELQMQSLINCILFTHLYIKS